MNSVVNESQIEYGFIGKLTDLKYVNRSNIHDRKSLEQNFREKFEALNRVHLTNAETQVRRMLSTDYANKVIVTFVEANDKVFLFKTN